MISFRTVLRTRLRRIICCTAWVALHLILVVKFSNASFLSALSLQSRFFVLLGAASLVLAELLFLYSLVIAGAVLWGGKRRGAVKFFQSVIGAGIALFVVCYFALLVGSWSARITKGSFLDPNVFSIVAQNPTLFFRHLTLGELLAAAGVVVVGAFGASIFFCLSSSGDSLQSIRRAGLYGLASLCFGTVVFCVLLGRSSGFDYRMLRSLTKYQLTPTMSFLTPAIFRVLDGARYPSTSNSSEIRYTLDDYARKVDLQSSGDRRRNIILIIVEALRADVLGQSWQNQEIMPTLNALAKGGLFLPRSFSAANDSAPSMASIITGLHPLKYQYRESFYSIDYPSVRVYELLSKAGYRTGYFSAANEKWLNMIEVANSPLLDKFFHAESSSEGKIFEHTDLDTGFYSKVQSGKLGTGKLDDKIPTDALIEWLSGAFDDSSNAPVFAMIVYQGSHFPYEQGSNIPGIFSPNSLEIGDKSRISFSQYPKDLVPVMRNRYFNSLAYIDKQIARILEALAENEVKDDTVVIVIGDHGEFFGEHDSVTHCSAIYNESLNVGFVLSGSLPEHTVDGNRVTTLLDVAPTILELAGLPQYPGFQGISVFGQSPIPRQVLSTVQCMEEQDSLLVWPWKMVVNRRLNKKELYHVESDHIESKDQALSKPNLAACLEEQLERMRSVQLSYFSSLTRHTVFPPILNDAAADHGTCLVHATEGLGQDAP